MENILKKALDEALTERYSGELNSAPEINHALSGDFERKMKGLIRRIDKPFSYYSKYIAAAACAVIAIGCAVLLPTLMNGKIEVNSPTDMAAAETTAAENNNIAAITTTAPVSASPDREITTVQTENMAENTVADTSLAETKPVEEEPARTEEAAEEEAGNPSEDEPAKNETSKNENSGETDKSIWDDEEAVEESVDEEVEEDVFEDDVEEDDCVVSDDDGSNPSTDPGTEWDDSDDDVAIEDDDDADIDGDNVFHPSGDEDDANTGCGGSGYEGKPIPDAATFGEIISLTYGGSYENLKAASCCYDGISVSFGDTDTDFVQDFIASLKSAVTVKYEEEPAITKSSKPISLEIRDVEPTAPERRTENFSDWLFYGDTFGTGEEYDMPDEESIWEQDYGTFFVYMEIYSDGTVRLIHLSDFTNKIDYTDYTLYLKADKSAAAKLFSRFSALTMPENAKTAGDLIEYFGITKTNITSADADIKGIYDTGYAAVPVSSAAAEKFFAEYASAALTATNPYDSGFDKYYSVNIVNCFPNDTYESRRWWFNDFYGDERKICMRLPLKNKGGALWVMITSNTCYVYNEYYDGINISGYSFAVKPESVIELYNRILSENNLTSITYNNLSEYLKGKNFTAIAEGAYYKVTGSSNKKTNIDDSEKLKKLTAEIKAEAKNCAYVPLGGYGKGLLIRINVENWKGQMIIYQNNMISLNGNYFAASEGFYDKLMAIIEG
ncbi:MAG: hypothetical protein ACI4KR_10145 [Ruminiclostridium sp.]